VKRRFRLRFGVIVATAALTACGGDLPPSSRAGEVDTSGSATAAPGTRAEDGLPEDVPPVTVPPDLETTHSPIVVATDERGRAIDRHVFGTNLPAWLGPETLDDPLFQQAVVDSGTTLLRMPGGSWSNAYDWLACETGLPGCFFADAARPSDFVAFLDAVGIDGMWTVSINATAEASAAAVAFFNASVGDDTPIGVDRNGVDWQTVGTWAEFRAAAGHPDPVGLQLWEIGNEVYGGTPDSGNECAPFGWEEVWTCDGAEYAVGTADNDGFVSIARAMRRVDPSIRIGAVGVAGPGEWSNWGNEVIDAAGDEMDFYVVHHYGYDASPDPVDATQRPAELWPDLLATLDRPLQGTPVAVTEYNLISFESGDTEQSMTKALNALFIADTIGEFIESGVSIANQWNVANGTTTSGSDYGLIDVNDLSLFPQYEALRLWSRAGRELLPWTGTETGGALRVYPTEHADGRVAIVLINTGESPIARSLVLDDGTPPTSATIESAVAEQLDGTTLARTGPTPIEFDGSSIDIELAPWSINVVEVTP